MPWNVSDVVEQRSRFLDDYDSDAYSMAELCRRYEISRQTGYKLLKRREAEDGLLGSESCAAPAPESNATVAGRHDPGTAAGASALGAEKASLAAGA